MITVVTPTYNRAKTLVNCFESLKKQTSKRFHWLIVDDGSNDNTKDLVTQWINKGEIWIEYIEKENGGKASALNLALEKVQDEYVVCLDSDDVFYSDTIEKAIVELEDTKHDERCCGILALRNNPDGSVMGNREVPKNINKITIVDLLVDWEYSTEVICFYKTNIIKKYRFPLFEGETFVSPSWIQYEIARKYYFKPSWSKLCRCEYIEDGLTRNKRKVIAKNPHGYTAVRCQSFDFAKSVRAIVRNGIMYDCGCIIGKDAKWLSNAPKKGWAIILMPFGYIAYLKRYRKLCKKRNGKCGI